MPPSRSRLPWYVRVMRFPGRVGNWLMELGAALVRPIEWLFALLGRGAMRVTEGFEGLESIGLRIGYVLSWPLRMLWKLVAKAADVLVPKSVRNVLATPLHWMAEASHWFGGMAMRVAEALNLDGAVLWLLRKTRWLWYPLAALGGFLQAWIGSRNYKQLLWGLPVVLVFGPILATATWSKLWGKGSIAEDYRLAVKQALEEKDFMRANLYERKLAQLGVDNKMTEYQTAAAFANSGNLDEAYERMKVLAPEESPGYAPAHSWILQRLLRNEFDLPAKETNRLIGIHLDHMQTLGARGPEFEMLRGLWQARTGQLVEAVKTLEPLVNRLGPAAVMRMEINVNLGQLDEARSDARAVRAHMTSAKRRDTPLGAMDYRSWAIAEELLGNMDASRESVGEWLKLDPKNQEARRSLSELCRRKFAEVLATPNPDAQELADLFIQAAELTDDQHLLQRQVGFLYRQRERIPVAEQVVKLVASSPRTHSAILEAAGTAAAEAGNHEQARTYLKQAVAKDPKNAIAWNNYAYIVMQAKKPDYEDALKAVNKALEILPDEYHFRETRGQILVNMKKWKEAIPDLEYAVNGMPTSRGIHDSLAKAYEAIGEAQLARLHRQQAQ